ncbi:MAG: Metallo-beta-lactamase superfamily protein [Lentisphaerae bacterium ADurb.BinA184]|nr:MAG: Metallo-beta-lactamase superfamily protein [Lentisphaerae bacterium ADurb.BinA184]
MSVQGKSPKCVPPEGTPIAITVLADNTVAGGGLLAEHGLAFWVETGPHRLLFDTGQGLALAANARQLRIALASVTAVALSHGHYDHTGGLRDVLAAASQELPIHMHPEALGPHFHCAAGGGRDIGLPADIRSALSRPPAHLILTPMPSAVAPGVFLTGEVERIHPQETIDEPFFRDAAGNEPDGIRDDQALFFATAEGFVVLLGCAHSGLINTLDTVLRVTGGQPIHTVIGGMHLRAASPARLAWTLESLRRFNLRQLLPTHCTGTAAAAALWNAFPGVCQPCGVGTRLTFRLASATTARPRRTCPLTENPS